MTTDVYILTEYLPQPAFLNDYGEEACEASGIVDVFDDLQAALDAMAEAEAEEVKRGWCSTFDVERRTVKTGKGKRS